MTDHAATTVLIAGAGPTGLTLACELARRGVAFRLVEAAPGPQPGSRGKGVQPRTLEVFDDLGIADPVLAHGELGMPVRSMGPDGRVSLGGAVPAALRDRDDIPYPASLVTPQWRVEQALRDLLGQLGGAVEFDTTLVGFEQVDCDTVAATVLRCGTAGMVTARWLVGCDGGGSAVRRRAGIGFPGQTREDVRMIVADVAVGGLGRDAWHMWRHPDGLVTLCPLPSTGLFQYQAGIAPGQDPSLDPANLQAVLERRSGRTDIRLRPPEWASLWRANVRLADRYRAGGVFLAGDAAHVHPPAGGQGMNTGIQDAHNLGWKLAAVAGGAPPALLDTYEAERRPVAAGVLALSDARLRQTLDSGSIPVRRDATTTQLDVGYRGSPLSRDYRAHRDTPEAAAAVRAGDRAPDTPGLLTTEGERRLFDLTRGGRWTLLDLDPLDPGPAGPVDPVPGLATLRVRDHPDEPGDIADPAGRLARAYGATGRTLVLIRPDGHVGLLSDTGDRSAVSAYLAAVSPPPGGTPPGGCVGTVPPDPGSRARRAQRAQRPQRAPGGRLVRPGSR